MTEPLKLTRMAPVPKDSLVPPQLARYYHGSAPLGAAPEALKIPNLTSSVPVYMGAAFTRLLIFFKSPVDSSSIMYVIYIMKKNINSM